MQIEADKTKFHGDTYDADKDRARLSKQLLSLFDVLEKPTVR